MSIAVRAALHVLGLNELPNTQEELKSVYRRRVKLTHPDVSEHDDNKAFHRVYRANEVLVEAIRDAGKPVVRVKFGESEPTYAKVAHNHLEGYEVAKDCSYLVALKWFNGLSVKVADGAWCEVPTADSFALDGVWIQFVY